MGWVGTEEFIVIDVKGHCVISSDDTFVIFYFQEVLIYVRVEINTKYFELY